MKKVIFTMFAICALLAVPCGGHAKASDEMRAADATVGNQPSVAPAAQTGGNTFVSDKFTMTYPDIVQESYADTEMGMLTATNDDIGINLNVTFSEMPWDPADYQEYYQGLTGMGSSSLYQFEPPRIDGKIMTFKGVDEDGGQVCTFFIVFMATDAGVTGDFSYPVENAAEIEPQIMPMLKSITNN